MASNSTDTNVCFQQQGGAAESSPQRTERPAVSAHSRQHRQGEHCPGGGDTRGIFRMSSQASRVSALGPTLRDAALNIRPELLNSASDQKS